MEAGEGGEAEAGVGDAPDDVGGFGGVVGSLVVGDGFGDAAEFDDGEFAGEPALEGVDAAADLGEFHGVISVGSFTWMDGIGITALFSKTRSYPLISFHLSRAFGGSWGEMGVD